MFPSLTNNFFFFSDSNFDLKRWMGSDGGGGSDILRWKRRPNRPNLNVSRPKVDATDYFKMAAVQKYLQQLLSIQWLER